jgi:glycosyltransferase involved in cell wall biosynthesis
LEALAHGTPAVVSTTVDHLVRVAEAGAGWAVAPAELGALLQRLECLDAADRQHRAEAARALAAQYDWSEIASSYESAYARVLA